MAEEEIFNLFKTGSMVHVARAGTITSVVERGLLSPIQLWKLRGKDLPEATIWHPFENRLVKFCALDNESKEENRKMLLGHFDNFGYYDSDDLDTWPIGYVVNQDDRAIRMWEKEPYFGRETHVPAKDVTGIVFAIPPLLLPLKSYLEIRRNKVWVERVSRVVEEAVAKGLLDSAYPLVDHFGRHLHLLADTLKEGL